MGKLRIKLAQKRHSKKVRSPKSPHQQPQQQRMSPSDSLPTMPPIPYVKCGFLQGKAPKVRPEQLCSTGPQSPINRKAADIPFPAAPATPLPKRWLRLGCDPCKQQVRLLHEDYKLPTRLMSPARAHQEEQQQQQHLGVRTEKSQLLSTASEGQDLRQHGRRSSSCKDEGTKSPYHQTKSSSTTREVREQEISWTRMTETDEVVPKLKKRSTASPSLSTASASLSPMKSFKSATLEPESLEEADEGRYVSARNSCDSGVYKLTAASTGENDSFYTWERDLSPLASESSIFTPENVMSSSASRLSSSSMTPAKEEKKLPSPCSRLRREDNRASCNWTSPSRLLEELIDAKKAAEDPEAVCRSWDGSPLNAESWRSQSSNKNTPSTSEQKPDNKDQPEKRSVVRKKEHHEHHRHAFTSRVMESFAVEKLSSNPYRDFRESMIDMVLKKELFQHGDLEELLKSYLILNDVELHDLIVQVFVDIWHNLFSIDK